MQSMKHSGKKAFKQSISERSKLFQKFCISTVTAPSITCFKTLCELEKVPCQTFANWLRCSVPQNLLSFAALFTLQGG